MVVGCAVLETAQPMMAQTSAPPAGDTLIFPAGDGARATGLPSARGGSGAGSWVFAGLVGAAGAGVWWWQRRRLRSPVGRGGARLAVEETRPLGNRQFLVVASCDGRRFLLGVAPGHINLLAPLDPVAPPTVSADEFRAV